MKEDRRRDIKFTRILGCRGTSTSLLLEHDYGELNLPWDEIHHVFAARIKGFEAGETPIIIMAARNQENLFFIDGHKISPRLFNFEDSRLDEKFERAPAPSKTMDLSERKFKWVTQSICSHLQKAYVDNTIAECIKGSTFFLPSFSSLKEAAAHCHEVMQTGSGQERKSLPEAQDEQKRISTPSTTREEWRQGMVIEGHFTIEDVKWGGMGIVYIVFDSQNARFYAVKTFQEKYLWNEAAIKQFVKEAEIWIDLGKHRNIVRAEFVKIIEGKPYIFLEYVPGAVLDDLMTQEMLPVKKSMELALQFCEGMGYAFRKLGLIHRDIKPSNCIVTKEGALKITDFGLGKIFDGAPLEGEMVPIPQRKPRSKKTSTSTTMVGTLPFMAPELFTNLKSSTVKSDIYSFGVLFYMMLTGINPFYHDDPNELIGKHLSEDPDPPHKLNSEVPAELSAIVKKCLRKKPAQRYENFDEIREALEKLYEQVFGLPYAQVDTGDMISEEDWINKGISLSSLNRDREALITFDQALQLNPHSIGAMIQKSRSLLRLKLLDEAMFLTDEVLDADRENWEAWYMHGEVLRARGTKEEALASYERALELDPKRAEILGSMGILLNEMGWVENALLHLDWALQRNPKLEEIWSYKGRMLIKQYKYEEASKCFDQAIEINPRMHSAWSSRGEVLYRLGFFAEAIEAYRTAITIDPQSLRERLRIGSCYVELGDRDRAFLSYDQVLKRKHDEIDAYLAKAALLEEMDLLEEAVRTLRKSLAYEPYNRQALMQLAKLYIRGADFEKSLSICEKLNKLGEENWEVILLRESSSHWIKRKKLVTDAIADIKPIDEEMIYRDIPTILSVFPDIQDAMYNLKASIVKKEDARKRLLLASLLRLTGNLPDAIEAAEKAVDLGGDSEPARKLLQDLIRLSDELKERQKSKKGILGTIIRRESKERSFEELFSSAMEKMSQKDYQAALGLFQECIEKNPDAAYCQFYLGVCCEMMGDREGGRKHLGSFIERFPDSPGYFKHAILSPSGEEQKQKEWLFRKWIGMLPRDPGPWLTFLRYLINEGEIDFARAMAKEIIRKYANNWNLSKKSQEFWSLLGVLELFIGNTLRASHFFTRSLGFRQKDPLALAGSAKCMEARGNFVEAGRMYEDLTLDGHSTVFSLYQTACLKLEDGSSADALRLINRALEAKPESLLLAYKKAQIYLESRDYGSFWNYYYSIYHMEEKFPSLHVLRTKAFCETEKMNEAFSSVRNGLNADPDNIILLDLLAFLNLRANLPERAMETFDRILKLRALYDRCSLGKGIACFMLGQYKEALVHFQKYLIVNPLEISPYICLGITYSHLGSHQPASLFLRNAVKMKSGNALAWVNLGIYYCRGGRYLPALRYAEWALRLEAGRSDAWLCKSKAEQELGRLEEAYRSVQQALYYSPQDLYGWIQRGIIEFQMQNYKLSLASFSRASEIDGSKAMLWNNRCTAAIFCRELQEARVSVERALNLEPEMFQALLGKAVLSKLLNEQDSFIAATGKARAIDADMFQKWYLQYTALKQGNYQDALSVHEVMPLPFQPPQYSLPKIGEPLKPPHYPLLDRNFDGEMPI